MEQYYYDLLSNFAGKFIEYNDEYAWRIDIALEVINSLSAKKIAILGGEVWLPGSKGPVIPMPFLYTWGAAKKEDDEAWEDFQNRVNNVAREYITKFQWDSVDKTHTKMTPFFNFLVSTAESY